MRTSLIVSFVVIMCLSLPYSFAQIDVKGKIKDKSINRADQRTDEGVDKGLDAVEDGVKSMFKKKENSGSDSENSEQQEEQSSEPNQTTEKAKIKKEEPAKLTSFTKYDFVPGDKVLLFDDFSQDAVGDFPAMWTTNGSGEVRTLNLYPGKWFYLNTKDDVYNLMSNLVLPQNYIFEFDVVPTQEEDFQPSFYLTMYQSDSEEFLEDALYPGNTGFHLTLGTEGYKASGYNNNTQNYGPDGHSELAPLEIDKLSHVIVWVQNRRLRVYHKGQKVIDMPTIIPADNKFNRFRISLWSQTGFPYISNLRFTTAAPDMRSKLLTEGKIVSYGIYFDVNSDKVKPESYGTLKEIAAVLTENPQVKIKIVGHTDGDGDAAKNLDLSKRRAASVKNELAASFGIDGARIETDGKGKTEPIAPNVNAANKAKNRRVEFIKL